MLVIYRSRTIHKNQDLTLHGEIGIQMVEDVFAPASLDNFGSIRTASATPGVGVQGIGMYSGWSWPGAVIRNEENGQFSVKATGVDSGAVGVFSSGNAPAVENLGLFKVQAVDGNAFGFDVYGGFDINNSGDIRIKAGGFAGLAVSQYDGAFVNSGTIRIDGTQAEGVHAGYFGMTKFDNTGRLVVHDATAARDSVAVHFGDPSLRETYTNEGVISADRAIVEDVGYGPGVEIDNSGLIRGTVTLGDYSDRIVNTGIIRGSIKLGKDGDSFDGSNGRHFGHVLGGGGGDELIGGRNGDHMWGDMSRDDVHGGNDTLIGGGGSDVLYGGVGEDRLDGGLNSDVLYGGDGADVFVYDTVRESHGRHIDLIADLTAEDTIDLSAIDADAAVAGNQAFTLVKALDGHAGELALKVDPSSGDTLLEADVNGDGVPDFSVRLAGAHADFTGFVL